MNDVSFAYENKNILNHINLKIRKGEVVALLGENGSGKSTLSKLIIGQLQPDSGELSTMDRHIKSVIWLR